MSVLIVVLVLGWVLGLVVFPHLEHAPPAWLVGAVLGGLICLAIR